MNMKSVIKGGLLAGLVIVIGESILNLGIVAEPWAEAMAELGAPEPSPAWIAAFVIFGFVIGIVGVWLYAAARPRLGAGPATALKIGAAVWFLTWFFPTLGYISSGLYPVGLLMIGLVWGLVEVPLAVLAGAWLYKEGETAAA